MTDWDSYLSRFHARRPGVTEVVLGRARDQEDADPYAWIAAPVPPDAAVVDLACGSAPL